MIRKKEDRVSTGRQQGLIFDFRRISISEGVVSKNTNELKTSATSYLSPRARCAPVNGLAGCYVSSIGKPHEYFDLHGAPAQTGKSRGCKSRLTKE